jgi:hypothetical protein
VTPTVEEGLLTVCEQDAAVMMVPPARATPTASTAASRTSAGFLHSRPTARDPRSARRLTRLEAVRRMIGAMVVANRLTEGTTFSDDDLRLLETLANQAAVALENGQLEQSLAELSRLKEQLRFQAYHDPLTGLANRSLFAEQVNGAIEHPTADGSRSSCSSTSTTSRTSATPSGTRPATGCSPPSPTASVVLRPATWPPASAATSSRSCSSTSRSSAPR